MKRTLAILLCILLLIPAFAVCASANEVYIFEYGYVEELGDSGVMCRQEIPDGTYILYYGADSALVSDPFEIKFEDAEIDEGIYSPFYQGDVTVYNFPLEFTVPLSFVKIAGVTVFFSEEGNLENTYFELLRVTEQIDPLPSVSDTLKTVIQWVGNVTTSLLSGELNGLLLLAAIPIAISVVLLTVKIIKKNSWGV